MKCTPLDVPFGGRLRLESDAPLTSEQGAELRRLFAEHTLLLVRDGELSAARQIDLLSQLGRVEPDSEGRPMEMEVTNQHERSSAPAGELIFHYDYAYDPEPIPAISMYGLVVAKGATSTLFASSSRVLERIPQRLRTAIEGREAAHACFLSEPGRPDERTVEPEIVIPRAEPGWGPAHYWARHPVVWHNAAGVSTLFVCLQHTDRIVGMARDESDALLEEIFGAMYDPAHVYEHVWRKGDLVLWDNLTVQHARPVPNDLPRTLRRYHVSNTNLTEDYLRVGRELGYV